MNPRPKTINQGFYILISKFKICCNVSFEMDTKQYSLKNLTFKVQTPLKGGLAKSTPSSEICKKDIRRTEAALRSYSVIIIICDYVYSLPSLRADKRLGMLPWASKSPSKPFRPQIVKDQLS